MQIHDSAAAIRDRITKMRDAMGKTVGEIDFHADDKGKGRRRRGNV